jgi:hypothetical protein
LPSSRSSSLAIASGTSTSASCSPGAEREGEAPGRARGRSGDSPGAIGGSALIRLYQNPQSDYVLYMLAEAMIEFDEMFYIWRLRHIAMVERMIGSKPGTGGSEGVAYLRTTLGRKFFPDLWELRTGLSTRNA